MNLANLVRFHSLKKKKKLEVRKQHACSLKEDFFVCVWGFLSPNLLFSIRLSN